MAFDTKKLSTAYHEAGHCLVASFFDDKLNLKVLTANKEYLKAIDPSFKGGFNAEWFTVPEETDYESADHLILVSLAGACAQTIHEKGQRYTLDNISKFKDNPKLIHLEGAVVDYELAKSISRPIALGLETSNVILEMSAFRWIFELMLTPDVWKCITYVAEAIIKHPNQTLLDKEIKQVVKDSKFDLFLKGHKSIWLSKRYPLNVANLTNWANK